MMNLANFQSNTEDIYQKKAQLIKSMSLKSKLAFNLIIFFYFLDFDDEKRLETANSMMINDDKIMLMIHND